MDRKPKPIVYHISANWAKEVWQTPYQTADIWSSAFKDTVAWLKVYSEKGIYDVRYCDTQAECKTDDLLWDADLWNTHPRQCTSNDECATSGSGTAFERCRADGICVSSRPCSSTQPCPLGQLCSQGVCNEAAPGVTDPDSNNPNHWVKVEPAVEDAGAYTVYFTKGAEGYSTMMSIDDPIPFVDAGTVRIALAHINTGLKDVGLVLQDENGTVCRNNDGSDMVFSYQGDETPYFHLATCVVDLGGASSVVRNFKIVRTDTGKTVAVYNFVTLNQQTIHTLAVSGNGEKSYVAHGSISWRLYSDRLGVRFAHLAAGEGALDFGVNGSRRAEALRFGEISEYTGMTQQDNRLLVSTAGAQGDFTCYQDNGVGQCMGWKAELDANDMARYQEIYDSLPAMFVACENVYTGDNCTEAERGDTTLLNDCRYWYEDQDGQWRNPCGEVEDADKVKLHGDIRYNMFYWIPEDQTSSPLGYGPTSANPETGEVYYGIANIYGAAMVSYGKYAADLLDLSIGELSTDDLMTGKYIKEYMDSQKNKTASESLYGALDVPREEIERRAIKHPQVERFWFTDAEEKEITTRNKNIEFVKAMTDPRQYWQTVKDALPPSMTPEQVHARFEKVGGTHIESLLINSEVENAVRMSQNGFDGALTTEMMNAASPLSWSTPASVRKTKEHFSRLAEATYYQRELAEPYVFSTANKVKEYCEKEANRAQFGWTEKECRHWSMTKWMLDGVVEHEVGHTVGLRHNFQASADAFNYQKQYYDIREKDYRRCTMEGIRGCFPGGYCHILCDADADCMPGTVCLEVETDGQTVKACVNEHMKPTGWCWDTKTEYQKCSSAADCSELGADAICKRDPQVSYGYCYTVARPNEQGVCLAGTLKGPDGTCIRDDQCDAASGSCFMDGSRTCTGDADCQVEYVKYAQVGEYAPVMEYVPRAEMTAKEKELGRGEFNYSSLMDYGGTINFDLHDIGKYDRAAIRFGYGEFIDTYSDIHKVKEAMQDVADYYGYSDYIYLSFYMDSEGWKDTWFNQFLYINDFIGIEENQERIPAPFRKVLLEKKALETNDRGSYDFSYYVVPYKYRGDEWRGNLETYVFDIGADMGEIAAHSWNKLHEYYLYDAFKRERWGAFRGANPMGYYSRIIDRWMGPLADTGRYYAMFYNVFRAYPSARLEFGADIMRLGAWQEYSDGSIAKLAALLTSPAPGSYRLVDEGLATERFVNYNYDMNAEGSQLNIPVGDGKFPYTTYWSDAGYYYYDHAAFIGSFWEKVAALQTMTYSLGYFVGDYLGEQVPVGVGTSIGFNSNYYTELTNLLGGMIVGRTAAYEPYVLDGQVRSVHPKYAWEAEGHQRVQSSIDTLSLKTYLLLFSYAYIPAGFDPSFMDSLFLCIKGNGSCYDLVEQDDDAGEFGVQTVEFTDPFSKKTFVAKTTNYDASRIDASYWLLTQANAKLAEWESIEWGDSEESDGYKEALGKELRETVELMDLIYTFNEVYGLLTY